MNKVDIVSFWIGLGLAYIFISSCKNFLDLTPKDAASSNTVWSSESVADLFLGDIYNGIPNFLGEPYENFSDNALNGINQSSASRDLYHESIYTAMNVPNNWANWYTSIRKCNMFIENVSDNEVFSTAWKKQRLGEAHFLRAYYYHLLWIWHGEIPIVDKVLNRHEDGDEIFKAKSTSDEAFDFIEKDLKIAISQLEDNPGAGHASKGAATALKGWVELYQASPLKNEGNELSKWGLAANTYQAIIQSGKYDLFSDYNDQFLEGNNGNVETIFAKQHVGGTGLANMLTANSGATFVAGQASTWSNTNPTQEVVDAYRMNNGLPIDNPGSGYDPQNPYANREYRFYESIIYDGSLWKGNSIIMKQDLGSRNATDLGDQTEATNTGYYWKKSLDEKYATIGNNQNSANGIIYRYAEILLGYAEAKNEINGPTDSVYWAINKVRIRGNIPELDKNIGYTKEEMRTIIHQERRVELAFEGKRWYDLLRLKEAVDKLNGTSHAMLIEKDNSGQWVYKVVPAPGGARKFSEKNYLLPIPQTAIDRNHSLKQNPDYIN